MDNRSDWNSGGGIFFGTEASQDTVYMPGTFNRLLLVNNWALYGGGGLFLWNATLNLNNSTFVMNEANDDNGTTSWQGGGLGIHAQTTANIVNTIFYDNTPNSIHDGTPNSSFDINYSVTEEYWGGDSNMVVDPQFVDIDNYENKFSSKKWKFIQGDDLKINWESTIDHLFIDTSHTYEQTLAELKKFGSLVRPGGIISLHDIISHKQVFDAIKEYLETRKDLRFYKFFHN